ncbi:hypothetical protein [Klebsiella aerogenes]|uniref:hypothetical protein n=1 Tax=Klebsiella aerogenes TaxID=548 RepID=UPI001F1FCF9D|nr:hypothetical protein [Klebsiella aerogenes]
MERLIHEMSYLFTKQRFMELQKRAHEIAMSNSEHPECFGFIIDAIEEFPEGLSDSRTPSLTCMLRWRLCPYLTG